MSLFRCEEFLRSQEHIDLDLPPAQLWEHQWEQFLTEYYSIIQGGAKIQEYYEGSRRSEDLLAQVCIVCVYLNLSRLVTM